MDRGRGLHFDPPTVGRLCEHEDFLRRPESDSPPMFAGETPVFRPPLCEEFECARGSDTPRQISPRSVFQTPGRGDCNTNPFSQVREGCVEENLAEMHLSGESECGDHALASTPRPVLPHAVFAIHNQSVASTPFCTPTSRTGQCFPISDVTPQTALRRKSFDDDFETLPKDPTKAWSDEEAPRFQFHHFDPSSHQRSFVPLHLDANGVIWLARHCVDGLPYAVKELSGDHSVELRCLTIGNHSDNLKSIRASHHITRYHTTCRQNGVTLLQCEYFVRGNVGESIDARTSKAINTVGMRKNELLLDEKTKHWMVRESFLHQSELITLIQHVLMALDVIHSENIVHGNPIVWNVFIATNYHFKLGNFGSASRSDECQFSFCDQYLPHNRSSFTALELDVHVFASSLWQLLISNAVRLEQFWCRRVGIAPRTRHTSFDITTFNELRSAGFLDYDERVIFLLQSMLSRRSIAELISLSCLNVSTPRIFHIQCAFDREIVKLLSTLDQLKHRQRSLSRKMRRETETFCCEIESCEPTSKTRKIEGSSLESTPQSSPQIRPACGPKPLSHLVTASSVPHRQSPSRFRFRDDEHEVSSADTSQWDEMNRIQSLSSVTIQFMTSLLHVTPPSRPSVCE